MLITAATLADGRVRDVRVDGETIEAVAADLAADGERVIDAAGRRLLPGMIDVHVHFREPGFAHKETWATGSRSAAAGGVTCVVDQPNTDPMTIDGDAFGAKAERARTSIVDYGLNGGVTADWDRESLFEKPLFALGEVFLADSTGDMGIDEGLFADALEAASAAGLPVTVHAEDADRFDEAARERDDADAWSAYRRAEAEIAAVERACEVAAARDARIHVAHTSTPEAVEIAADAGMTTEVTPHHVFRSRADLPELGTHGRMNPPLRSEDRRARLWDQVVDGPVDMIATDHAPHTGAEKEAPIWDAPSGVPGVETALPLLLAETVDGPLSWERVRDLTAANPAARFDLPGKGRIEPGRDADLVLVDPDDVRPIRADDRHTKCDWTPFEGLDGLFPDLTLVRGQVAYERTADGERFGEIQGRNVREA
jgi:dihydroorotase